MSSLAVQLPQPVPIDAIATREDRFRCPPYNVVLFAGACVKRQAVMRADPSRSGFSQCVGCVHGAAVEQQTGGAIEAEASTPGKRWMGAYYAGTPAAARKLTVLRDEKQAQPPPPAPPVGEPIIMPTCTHEGCDAIVRLGKFKEPPPAGTETLCAAHRVKALGATDAVSQKLVRQHERRKGKASAPAATPPREPKPRTPPEKTTTATSRASVPAPNPAALAQQLVEAHALVTTIGWDLVRQLARAVTGGKQP